MAARRGPLERLVEPIELCRRPTKIGLLTRRVTPPIMSGLSPADKELALAQADCGTSRRIAASMVRTDARERFPDAAVDSDPPVVIACRRRESAERRRSSSR